MATTGKLICAITGRTIKVGDEVVSYRGELYVVTGWRAPVKATSEGRVFVQDHNNDRYEFFPAVFELKFDLDE